MWVEDRGAKLVRCSELWGQWEQKTLCHYIVIWKTSCWHTFTPRKDKKTATNCMKIDGAKVKRMYVFLRDYLKNKCAFCQHCVVFTQKLLRHMCFQRSCNFLSDFLQILSNSCRRKSSCYCNEWPSVFGSQRVNKPLVYRGSPAVHITLTLLCITLLSWFIRN